MFSNLFQWLKRTNKPLTGGRRSRCRRQPSCCLQIERLETRLTPAFNLTISTAATVGVLHTTAGTTDTYTANASGANVRVSDIRSNLFQDHDVIIKNGATGTETGSIFW